MNNCKKLCLNLINIIKEYENDYVAIWRSVLSASLLIMRSWVRIPVTANVVIGFELSHGRFVRVYNSGHTLPQTQGQLGTWLKTRWYM